MQIWIGAHQAQQPDLAVGKLAALGQPDGLTQASIKQRLGTSVFGTDKSYEDPHHIQIVTQSRQWLIHAFPSSQNSKGQACADHDHDDPTFVVMPVAFLASAGADQRIERFNSRSKVTVDFEDAAQHVRPVLSLARTSPA
ncbi:hypothetical protein RGQ15_21840 [Paracoccus sp. MBLB3053]|uniref:Uncharacterized protein n=1 Tax=Paracoccus aurantius TaxID=3073814 RepID=A0ABU2I0W8_9RHOB|nr:hypothetical protein [Paracoccus sp. MBLB3053]MDS9470194.1 hypothetical protein [Paracoccus sp. MBLB3053]